MDLTRLARKITFTLFLAMSLGSAGFLVAATVNTIVGADISGNPAWAGLPAAMFTLGTALSAFLLGFAMERFGRRLGMLMGLAAGYMWLSRRGALRRACGILRLAVVARRARRAARA